MLGWVRELSVGWPEIDDQHVDLVRRAAEIQARVKARDAAGAARLLDGFLEATVRHFATEEELMERSQYGERRVHRGAHDLFVQDLHALAAELAAAGLTETVVDWAMVRMPEWLTFHIQTNDAPLGSHLRRGLARSGPARPPGPTRRA
jgi:hemerythrin